MQQTEASKELIAKLKKELEKRGPFEVYHLAIEVDLGEEAKAFLLSAMETFYKEEVKETDIFDDIYLAYGVILFEFKKFYLLSCENDILVFARYLDSHFGFLETLTDFKYHCEIVPDEDGN